MPTNSTSVVTTVTHNATTTATFVATTTSTVHGTTLAVFNPTTEIGLIVGFLILVGSVLYFRSSVKGLPVMIRWIYKNGQAVLFKGQQDVGGLFIGVLNARGKRAESLKATGTPIEVFYVPEKAKAYVIEDDLGREVVTDKQGTPLKDKKGNQITKAVPQLTTAYMDVSLGGLKHVRMYDAVEGVGKVVDWNHIIKSELQLDEDSEEGASGLYNEEMNAMKGIFRLFAEALVGTLRGLLMPYVAGLGTGAMLLTFLFLFTGHFK